MVGVQDAANGEVKLQRILQRFLVILVLVERLGEGIKLLSNFGFEAQGMRANLSVL